VASMNTPRQVLVASLVGTAIEFFDFYIYATAAVLVFPSQFFPTSDPATATLASLATFAIAFVARPVGSALFGHFGDRIGRKATLVAALLTMGASTVAIGALPSYDTIGLAAPALLALCRFGQGLGLGGAWGWGVPFLASAMLVAVGLYVRLSITETPVFAKAIARDERVRLPMATVIVSHTRALVVGTLIALSVFVNFYLMTVFTLSWGTTTLGYTREQFLYIQLFGVLFFGLTIPWSAIRAERGRRPVLIAVNVAACLFGLVMAPLLASGWIGATLTLGIGMSLVGLAYGPLGTVLAELFPTAVRYTGSSITYNLAGIFGASLAPYAATWLATNYGLQFVGYYLSAATLLSLAGLAFSPETKDEQL
jgi:MFS family permease